MLLKTITVLCLIGASSALFGPDWNDLKVTWGINPFTNFNSQPRTTADAIEDGFVKISSCDESATSKWRGDRYMKGNDSVVILLFGKNGYIAGIQSGIPEDAMTGYPKNLVGPFVKDGDKYYITAYFSNPDIICSTGRTAAHYDTHGTGTELLIQNGTDPTKDLMEVPMKETDMANTKWTKGKCFRTMGDHYWYEINEKSSCDRLFPVFALYNRGELNAFGFAFVEQLDSPQVEHPAKSYYPLFMDHIPTCLSSANSTLELSTIHIFLTKYPLFDLC